MTRAQAHLAAADFIVGIVASFVLTSGVDVVWALAALPVWVVLAKFFSLYDRDHRSIRHLTVDELSSIAGWAAATLAAVAA